MLRRYTIQIPDRAPRLCVDLLSLLEKVLPLQFGSPTPSGSAAAGEIQVSDRSIAQRSAQGKTSTFGLPGFDCPPSSNRLINLEVKFASEKEVPFPFRGRVLRTEAPADSGALVLRANEQTLAASPIGPVWTLAREAGVNHYRSAFPLPIVPTGGNLTDVLNGQRFLELLPFLHWLREICVRDSFEGPSLRACFIFDDPNLHWPTYGFVNYQETASHAQKENYHVSFATIPLDGWFIHKPTVEIFRQNSRWLSLSVHGNNHIKGELGRAYSEAERSFLLQEAIQRLESLERRTGLSVSRVMIPPHGACSESMLAALPTGGFAAACISHGSLRHHNKPRQWTEALGFRPAEWVLGCPVLPRWGFSGNVQNTILLAAYLKQAIILRAHHQDLKDGLELLDHSAQFINALGPVEWLNMADMAQSNYQWRVEDDRLWVKPLSRKIVCSIPDGIKKIQVDTNDSPDEVWEALGPDGPLSNPSLGKTIDLEGATQFSLEAPLRQLTKTKVHLMPSTSLWFIRRLLTEGRDRLQPTLR